MIKLATLVSVLAACGTVNGFKSTCPMSHPWVYTANNGKDYCCSTADDCNGNVGIHYSAPRTATCCKGGENIQCVVGTHRDAASCTNFNFGTECPGTADFAMNAINNLSDCCDNSRDYANHSNANYYNGSRLDPTYRFANCKSGYNTSITAAAFRCSSPPCRDARTMEGEIGCFTNQETLFPIDFGNVPSTDFCRQLAKRSGQTYFGMAGDQCRAGKVKPTSFAEGSDCVNGNTNDGRFIIPTTSQNRIRAYQTDVDHTVKCYFTTDNFSNEVYVDGKLWPKLGPNGAWTWDTRWEVHFPESTKRLTVQMNDSEKGLNGGGLEFFCETNDRHSKWYKFGSYTKHLDKIKVMGTNLIDEYQNIPFPYYDPEFDLDTAPAGYTFQPVLYRDMGARPKFENLLGEQEPTENIKRIGLYDLKYMTFVMDLEDSEEVNLSTAVASMSSQLDSHVAERCIDGDVGSYCHTKAEQDAWIRVDLPVAERISHVYMLKRTDHNLAQVTNRLRTFEVRSGVTDDLASSTLCETGNMYNMQGWMARCSDEHVKHIWIINKRNDYLHLAEIRMFALPREDNISVSDFNYNQSADPVSFPSTYQFIRGSSSFKATVNVAENRDTPGVIISKSSAGSLTVKNQELVFNGTATGKILDLNTPYDVEILYTTHDGAGYVDLYVNGDLIISESDAGFSDPADGNAWTVGANADKSNAFHGTISSASVNAISKENLFTRAPTPPPTNAPTIADGDVANVSGITCDDVPELVFDNFWHDYKGRTHVDLEDGVIQFSVKGGANSNINILLADKNELENVEQLSKNDSAYELFIGGANEPLIHSSTCLGCAPDADSIVDISGFPFIVDHKYNNIWIKVEGTVLKVGNGDAADESGLAYTRDFGGDAKDINRAIFTYGYGDIECHDETA